MVTSRSTEFILLFTAVALIVVKCEEKAGRKSGKKSSNANYAFRELCLDLTGAFQCNLFVRYSMGNNERNFGGKEQYFCVNKMGIYSIFISYCGHHNVNETFFFFLQKASLCI